MTTFTCNLTTINDAGIVNSGGLWIPAITPMSAGATNTAGIRFQNVIVPKNAIISSATVSFNGYIINNGSAFGLAAGENSDNAPAWVDPGVLPTTVAKTAATITVPSTSPWDVTDIVQEIVNRAGWASGNALAFVSEPFTADGNVKWDNTAASQTVLTVVYTGGVSAGDTFKKTSLVTYSAAAWPYVFQNGSQPYGARRRWSPSFLPPAVVNNPPFQNVGETSAQQAIALAMAQPNPWGYNFPGGLQPYAPRRLPAVLINNPPPFVPPSNPPFQAAGRTAQARAITQLWQPNPWVYAFAGAGQPYTKGLRTPYGTPVNDPPFRHRGKSSQVLTAIRQWQPDAWPKMYFGGRGPYARGTLPPVLIAVPPNIGQKIVRNVVVRQRLVFGPGKEPGLQ